MVARARAHADGRLRGLAVERLVEVGSGSLAVRAMQAMSADCSNNEKCYGLDMGVVCILEFICIK